MLVNLVGNAVKFTNEGEVSLSAMKDFGKSVDGTIDLVVTVKDTGIGIPEDDLNKIFEAFRQQSGHDTRAHGGTGLGLSISKKLVEMMSGNIYVESTPGEGSVFTVRFENVEIAPSQPVEVINEVFEYRNIQFENGKILVVDDVESNRVLLKELLSLSNLTVLEAENGQEALLLADEFRPDIIFMDLRMPLMNGFEALKRLKADPKLKGIPVTALTATAASDSIEKLELSGFDGYLAKPVVIDALYREICKYIPYTEINRDDASIIETDIDVNSLTADGIKEPSVLMNMLLEDVAPAIEKFRHGININSIREFSRMILSLGETHNVHVMIQYADRLYRYAEYFDVKNIKKSLKEFDNILKNLKAVLEKENGK